MTHITRCNYNGLTFIDLFAGIGGIRLAFEANGCRCVFSSEWDVKAQATYRDNFGETPAGDITKIREGDVPDHDILLAGFPCQPFSIIGKMQGFEDTRGTLFFDIARIIRAKRPQAILLENVKQFMTHDGGKTFSVVRETLEGMGYFVYFSVLNALDYGVPQKRERTIIVAFKYNLLFNFPDKVISSNNLSSILDADEKVERSLFASDRIVLARKERIKSVPFYPSIWHENKAGNISILPYSVALRAGASYNYILVNGIRRPSSRELLRIQGFPETYRITVSHADIRRQTGNSVAVPMVKAVAEKMVQSLLCRHEGYPVTQLALF